MKILGFEVSRANSKPTRFLGDLVKVDLSPGDVCVLMARRAIASEEAATIQNLWRATIGDDVTLLLLDDGMKIGVLSPPQAVAVHERLTDEAAVEEAITG